MSAITPKLIRRMREFANTVTSEDLAGLSRLNGKGDRPAFKGQPSFVPPPDYMAVETLEDLRQALKSKDYQAALTPYFTLKRLLNF